jgi:putative lipoic acid-binding regulatory protein
MSESELPNQEPPKIEFPCRYPVKVMGVAGEEFRSVTLAIFEKHAGVITETDITVRASTGGNYEALTVTITATGIDHLEAIFADLKIHPLVRMVL